MSNPFLVKLTITDESGTAVSGANVNVTTTGNSFSWTSNSDGIAVVNLAEVYSDWATGDLFTVQISTSDQYGYAGFYAEDNIGWVEYTTGTANNEFNKDFECIWSQSGVKVLHTPRTQYISSISGDEDFTSGTAIYKKLIFALKKDLIDWDKEGIFERVDAMILAPASETITKNDLVTYDNKTYIIYRIEKRRVEGNVVCKECELRVFQ